MINNNVSFKGAMLVKGSNSELTQISNEILKRVYPKLSKNGQTKPNFLYDSIAIECNSSAPNLSVLFTTQNETRNLYQFIAASRKIKLTSEQFKEFYIQNISKYLKVPLSVDSREVLNAIRFGKFDFVNLTIKK